MRKWLAGLFVVGLVLSPVCALAANQTGHGTNGNSGNGFGGGGVGNQGNGGSNGNAGGNHGGDGGHGGNGGDGGHGGGNGDHGNGGGSHGNGGGSTSDGAVSASPSTPDGGGTQTAEGRGSYNYDALRACTSPGAGFAGLVDYRVKADGSFTYWGVEYALPTFVQCMKDKGVQMSTAGRNELTNFGQR